MATYTVTNTNDSGSGSLRQAILDSNANAGADIITFDPLIGGETIELTRGGLAVRDELEIVGLTGVNSQITIDANLSEYVFNFISGSNSVEVSDLTITGAESSGIISSSASTILERASITNNTVGIKSFGNITISDSVISGNSEDGISLQGYEGYYSGNPPVLEISNSTVSNNGGEGINSYLGIVEAIGSTFSENYVGILASRFGILKVHNSTISRNQDDGIVGLDGNNTISNSIITGNGGAGIFTINEETGGLTIVENSFVTENGLGIAQIEGELELRNSTVGYNSGDGVSSDYLGSLGIENSTISGNGESGIFLRAGTAEISNSTISNNYRGIYNSNDYDFFDLGTVDIVSTIVSNNESLQNPDLLNDGGTINATNSLIEVEDDQINGTDTNNIFGQDPLLDPIGLQDNGGPTPTIALLPNSPAIDAGINPLGLDNDQRGTGFPRVVGGQADVGAFEVQGDEPKPSDNPLLFSLSSKQTINGLTANTEDIVQFDGDKFSIFFDGSDVGLGGFNKAISAFDVIDDNKILMSFKKNFWLPGFGRVNRSDVLLFNAQSLGRRTRGSFSLYLDGSDVGLTRSEENIDALTGQSDGSLLLSTTGTLRAKDGYSARNEDISLFKPTSTGTNTQGTFSKYFDGSDVGLGSKAVNAFGLDRSGELLFSTTTPFSTNGLSAKREDVFAFEASRTGNTTRGTFVDELFFDGSIYGLRGNNIVGVDPTFSTI